MFEAVTETSSAVEHAEQREQEPCRTTNTQRPIRQAQARRHSADRRQPAGPVRADRRGLRRRGHELPEHGQDRRPPSRNTATSPERSSSWSSASSSTTPSAAPAPRPQPPGRPLRRRLPSGGVAVTRSRRHVPADIDLDYAAAASTSSGVMSAASSRRSAIRGDAAPARFQHRRSGYYAGRVHHVPRRATRPGTARGSWNTRTTRRRRRVPVRGRSDREQGPTNLRPNYDPTAWAARS